MHPLFLLYKGSQNSMSLANTDLNLFKIFDVIYREANITKAAQALGITQPAVSNALSRMRQLFNDELFIRTSKGMKPTPLAQNIYPSVRSALKLLRTSVDEGRSFDPTSETTFNLCVNTVSQLVILPDIIPELSFNFSNIKLITHSIQTTDLIKALNCGTIDVAVEHGINMPAHIKRKALFDDDYVCVVRKDHPRIKQQLTLKQFESEQHLLLVEQQGGYNPLEIALAEQNIKQDIIFTGNNYITMPPVLIAADAIMTVERTLAQSLHNHLGIQILEAPFKVPKRTTFLYWHENAESSEANQWLRETIINAVKNSRIITAQ